MHVRPLTLYPTAILLQFATSHAPNNCAWPLRIPSDRPRSWAPGLVTTYDERAGVTDRLLRFSLDSFDELVAGWNVVNQSNHLPSSPDLVTSLAVDGSNYRLGH